MTKFFLKEVGGDCYLPDGRKITSDFEYSGDGFISTSVGYLIHQIGNAIKEGIGGFREITEQEFNDALKKKETEPESPRRNNLYRPSPSSLQGNAAGVREPGVTVPVPPKPDPIRVPTPDQMKPRKGPIPKEAFI